MELLDLIRNRESIRNYDPVHPVEPEVLNKILEAGRLAPSAANRQPWRFYLVSSPANLEKIRDCYHREWFKKAPHVLIVAGKRAAAWSKGEGGFNSLEIDTAIAMDHMILEAESLGVGTCWVIAFDHDKLRQTALLEEDEVVFAITPIGYPEKGFVKSGNKIRKPAEEIIRYL